MAYKNDGSTTLQCPEVLACRVTNMYKREKKKMRLEESGWPQKTSGKNNDATVFLKDSPHEYSSSCSMTQSFFLLLPHTFAGGNSLGKQR